MRKYTINYYLEFLKKQNTVELYNNLRQYCDIVVRSIQDHYKDNSKGEFIDYVAKYEDFYMITTYRIEDLFVCAFCVIREKNGKKHFQYYEKISYFGLIGWQRHKMNMCLKRYLYAWNLQELLANTEYKYSSVWDLAKRIDVSARNLLGYCRSENIEMVEYLTKMGCYRLAKDCINNRFCCYITICISFFTKVIFIVNT